MIDKIKFKIGIFLFAMLVAGMVSIPTVSAQEERKYNVTAEEAFEHANAYMISFIAGDAPGFENWTGASIDPEPLELYDINGQKLFYQFSVYNEKRLIGTIDIYANKTLGHSLNDITFDPEPYKTAEAMKKSKEIAKKNYPTEEIKSTVMVVYSYPKIGAMTVVKDKTTGVEHRIFIDGYTLNKVQDKPVTDTEPGVWSMYEQRLKNGVEENLKEWEKCENYTKSVEQAAVNKGINISTVVTEENIKKLSSNAAIATVTSGDISVTHLGQETDYYCIPTSIRMLSMYFNKPTPIPSQTSIYNYLEGVPPVGLTYGDIEDWVEDKWDKTPTVRTSALYNIDAVTEIDNERPFFSMISGHCRVCRGYLYEDGYFYLHINDPWPVGSSGRVRYECTYGGPEVGRVYVR